MLQSRRRRSVLDYERATRIELTPMIDVTFLILIFFMCTLQFRTLQGKLQAYLPRNGLGSAPEIPPERPRITLRVLPADAGRPAPARRVAVTIAAGRRVAVLTPAAAGSDHANELTAEPAGGLAEVAAWLRHAREVDPSVEALIDASPDVPHAAVVRLVDLAHACDIAAVSFTGLPQDLVRELERGNLR